MNLIKFYVKFIKLYVDLLVDLIVRFKVRLFHWKWLTGKCFQYFHVFVSRKISGQRKIFFLVNWKSSHFSVKCLTDLKNVKHFTNFFFLFFFRKIFSRKSFSEKYFPKSDFLWNKQNFNILCKKVLIIFINNNNIFILLVLFQPKK